MPDQATEATPPAPLRHRIFFAFFNVVGTLHAALFASSLYLGRWREAGWAALAVVSCVGCWYGLLAMDRRIDRCRDRMLERAGESSDGSGIDYPPEEASR